MCIATAGFISTCFLIAHVHFYPWKSDSCNRLQTLALSELTLMYFIGILLKTHSIQEEGNDKFVGGFLVFLVVSMILLGVAAIVVQYRAVQAWKKELKYAKAQLRELYADPIDSELQDHMIQPSELELGKLLGSGAEGQVYKASYANVEVAVKVSVLSQITVVPMAEQIKFAEAEARTMMKLTHPNIVRFYGIAIEQTSMEVKVMTVLALCNGSVADLINESKARDSPVDAARSISLLTLCRQMAQGVAYLHSHGVMHRDLKPANGRYTLCTHSPSLYSACASLPHPPHPQYCSIRMESP
jgi:hypothetical protein